MPETHLASRCSLRACTSAKGLARLTLLCLMLVGCGNAQSSSSQVLRVKAGHVVDGDDQPVWLRGAVFSNWILSDEANLDPPTLYADQRDYERVAAMGMNTVALYFGWDFLEDDAGQAVPGAFDWLDQQVAWAKSAGLRLILTLGYALGSDQTSCDGNTLWDSAVYQQRTLALWQTIAQRYAGEPAIAGYNLLAGPLPSASPEQWHTFANQLVQAIRQVDQQHILVVEPAVGAACVYYGVLDATDLFRVDDPKVLYEFDADVSWEYVAQLLPSQNLGDGGAYPDENRLGALGFGSTCGAVSCMQFETTSYFSTPQETELALKPNETSWTEKTFVYRVTNPDYQIAIPALQSDDNSGKVYFDDFVVKEYDEALNLVRTVMDVDLEDTVGWYLFQEGADGNNCPDCGAVASVESDAHRGNASVSVSGTTTYASLSNGSLAFPARLNYSYEMTGWIRGQNSDPAGVSRFRFDFWKYNANGGILPLRNRDNLALYLQSFVAWGKAQGVPLYVGDFGTDRPTFMSDKGGERWVGDMIDLLKANNLHFAYEEYHGDNWGIYAGDHGLPDPANANQPLIDLLTSKLVPQQ